MKHLIFNTPKGERIVGPGYPCFIIAEVSGNHDGKYEKAVQIIDEAIDSGADAIKLQTYTSDTMTIDCNNKWFQVNINDAWKGRTLYELYKIAYTPWEWQKKLKKHAESRGVLLFSTPFDSSAVDFLENLDVVLYKVASFEAGDVDLLKKIASTKKPVILSRGLQSETDVKEAIKILYENGCSSVAVLHCISSYPATIDQMNVSTVKDIQEKFDVVSGLSDHSLGLTASLAAVSLGALIIEKHFTTARSEGGVDAAFSLEPKELKNLVQTIRELERAIGKPTYELGEKEKENLVFKRSIFLVKDMKKGEIFSEENIRVIRPGYGMAPKFFREVLGKKCSLDIQRGTPLIERYIAK